MDSADTALILSTLERHFQQHAPLDDRLARFREPADPEGNGWQRLAELGAPALPIPEALDGLGAGWAPRFAVLRAAGAAARPEPLALHLAAADWLLERHPEMAAEVAANLAAGEMRLGLAEIRHAGDAARLTTGPALVFGGYASHLLLIVTDALGGCGVALAAAGAEGLTLAPARLLDGRPALRVTLAGCAPGWLVPPGQDDTAVQALRDRLSATLFADAVGAFEAGFSLTLDYLKQRRQFGQALAGFQALQHAMADLYCDLQQGLALQDRLAAEMDLGAGTSPLLPVAGAFLHRRLLPGLGRMIQVSGGIGMTAEYALGLHYKRVQVAAGLAGDLDTHLARITPEDQLLAATG